MYVRTIKVPSSNGTINEYVRVVEAYREHGKVKQRTIADLGRKDVLLALLPQLERVVTGAPKLADAPEGDLAILHADTWGPVLVARTLFDEVGLWDILDGVAAKARGEVSFADRAFVLVANRLVCPKSEHGLARWLETDFVCDRLGRRFVPQWKTWRRVRVAFRQLHAWYRSLDRLQRAKNAISDERRAYEQRLRERAMERTRRRLERLQRRVAAGKLKKPEAIGAAAARALSRHHGDHYYTWQVANGAFTFQEHPLRLEREQAIEGKYVLLTTAKDLTPQGAVQQYKELMDVESGFRSLKDVLAMRPIYHQVAPRVKAHTFVAALALLLQRLLERRLARANVNLSAAEALEAVETVRVVTFRLDGQSPRQGVSMGSPRARQVLKALGISCLRPPPPTGPETEVS